jgi:hypothetical protein
MLTGVHSVNSTCATSCGSSHRHSFISFALSAHIVLRFSADWRRDNSQSVGDAGFAPHMRHKSISHFGHELQIGAVIVSYDKRIERIARGITANDELLRAVDLGTLAPPMNQHVERVELKLAFSSGCAGAR